MTNFVCDLCGYQSTNRGKILSHLADRHGIKDPGEVGAIDQKDGKLTLTQGDEITEIDLEKWFRDMVKPQELLFLHHEHTESIFSAYGLPTSIYHQLKGILMVDRPKPVEKTWLDQIESLYGSYELYQMTEGGERGLACLMNIEDSSWQYIKSFNFPLASPIVDIISSMSPLVTLNMSWDDHSRLWVSRIMLA